MLPSINIKSLYLLSLAKELYIANEKLGATELSYNKKFVAIVNASTQLIKCT